MKTSPLILMVSAVGLIAGWGSAALFKKDEARNGSPSDGSVRSSSKAAPKRPEPREASRLEDVQACKDLIAASATEDDRHPLLRQFDRERALRRWIELDAEGALSEAERRGDASFAQELFRQWAALDPKAALEAMKRTSRSMTGLVVKDVFLAVMAFNPSLAAAELKDERWKKAGSGVFGWESYIAAEWMRCDPEAAIASLGAKGTLEGPDSSKSAILVELAKTDFPAAWSYFANGGLDDEGGLASACDQVLARGLLSGDAEALRILGDLPAKIGEEQGGRDPRAGTALYMIQEDLHKAMEWAKSRPADDPLRRQVIGTAADKIASSDPRQALTILQESGDAIYPYERESVLRASLAAITAENPEEALERIGTLGADQRMHAMGGYLTHMFAVDSATATEQCRTWLANPDLRGDLPAAFAKAFSWAAGAGVRDPGPILQAVPELNDAVDGDVLATWAKADPEATAEWITGHISEKKNLGLKERGVLSELAITRPEFTSEWLLTLPDEKTQVQAALTLTSNWGSFDPTAARAWTDDLPEGALRKAAEEGMEKARNAATQGRRDPFSRPSF